MNDNASNHNFHLEGLGVNMATGIVDIQVADWTVDLGDGYYTYHCDMHPSLSATFAVGTRAARCRLPAPAPAPVVTPIPVPRRDLVYAVVRPPRRPRHRFPFRRS